MRTSLRVAALAVLLACGCGPDPATAPTDPEPRPVTVTAGRLSDDVPRFKGKAVRVYISSYLGCGPDAYAVRWSGGPRSPVVVRFAAGGRRPGGGAGYAVGTCDGMSETCPDGLKCPAPLVLVTGCVWEPEP